MADQALLIPSPSEDTSAVEASSISISSPAYPHGTMKYRSAWLSTLVAFFALVGGLGYVGFHIVSDVGSVSLVNFWPYAMLVTALVIALGFEFVNGFHDTANAVAMVIYTHSLEPNLAVVWSGICNLAGVLASSGVVAYSIITLLPVELILQVSSGAGFSMVFALLIAAILWNLSTWWFGLPASSSHTMVGSIIGVGLANQFMSAHNGGSGIDWEQAMKVFKALIFSPILGFGLAYLLLRISKALVKYKDLYETPKNQEPPPWPVRLLLLGTCTGVSFYHGSNDGQKGMGLIMLILIGTVPTAYALNHAVTAQDVQDFIAASEKAGRVIESHHPAATVAVSNPSEDLTEYIRTRQLGPQTVPALEIMIQQLDHEVAYYHELKSVPANELSNMRNGMYLASESLRLMERSKSLPYTDAEWAALDNYKSKLDKSTKYIPDWVKVAVALALGLGTMVGWKRIVVTVGERIGKSHLNYAQGAVSGLVTMGTIALADGYGMPVSTTHVLSSGVAGSMAANKSGLQLGTLHRIATTWVLTLPAAALLSGSLYWIFRHFAQ